MTEQDLKTENVRWDLSFLYSSVEDSQIGVDADKLVELEKAFNAKHKGKLGQTLGQAIIDLSEMNMLENKIFVYLHLATSLNVSDPAVKAKQAELSRKLSQADGEYMTFFQLELMHLDDAVLDGLYSSNEVVARHRPWIEYGRLFKPHILTEEVESALTKRSPFGPHTWGGFFDELEADLEFEFGGEKKTLTEMLNVLLKSKDTDERAEVMRMINDTLGRWFGKYSAQTLYMVAGSKNVEQGERKYKHPMEAANKRNHTPDAVVEALHKAVADVAGPLARRYYRLKAAHLGLKTLRWSDRNAPLPITDTTNIPFDEAIEMVLAAYESFSPTLAGIIRESIAAKRIDAPAVKGKESGAFNNSTVLPGNKPVAFTFLNYLGSSKDVMTLAHELGHGVHGILAGQAQGPLMYGYPMAYAETASVFGEMTTFNFLRRQMIADGNQLGLLGLLMGKIEDSINTMVRQTAFSNFERRLHGMDASYRKWEAPKKLSVKELDDIWLETTREIYGQDGEVFTYENTEHLWAYIPHFHRPFYVYCYAFGALLTQSIYAQQERMGDKFEPFYLDLLRAGMTKDIIELTSPFGLDPTSETFWADGIRIGLGAMVEEAESLSRSLGVLK